MNDNFPTKNENTSISERKSNPWLFKKGVSGNPAGRPVSLWGYVHKKTNDGKDIINEVYAILKKSKSEKIKLEAARILLHAGGYISLRSAEGMDVPENPNIALIFNFFKAVTELSKDNELSDRLAKLLESAKVIPVTELLQDQKQESTTNQPKTE